MFEALFTYQFLQNAVIAGLLASVVCGIIGVIIVEKKMVMLSGGIAHTAYGGVGLGYLCGFEPIFGAFLFSVLAAFGIGFAKRKGGVNTDIIIALLWSLGMALGIAFVGLMSGYPPDLNSYLFGNILSVTRMELVVMLVLTCIVAFVIVMLYNNWKSYLFDEQFASINGMKTTFLEYLLLVLIALTIVVLIRVAGIILVIALLTAPAAIASFLSHKFSVRIFISVILGMVFCCAGLFVSYCVNIASGASIVIISVLAYAVVYACVMVKNRVRR
ncbi:MAG TPA: metal ABC transporter permease [Methanocorpusculum sp.]|nr:metal ABC transporter permease [Methanocorpusculum sp.]